MVDLPKEALETTKPEARQAFLQDAIKKLFKDTGIKSRNVVTSSRGTRSLSRYVKLPFMSAEELRGAIATEASNTSRSHIDQVILDFQILGEVQEEGRRNWIVLLVAAKNEAVDQHLSALKCGVDPADHRRRRFRAPERL
jgi:Tfp pilus assembly PilM family ATPase